MTRQALGLVITMLRIAKVYQAAQQRQAQGLQTLRDWLVYRRAYRKKSRAS
jgi:hypothetical protein